MSFSAYYVRKYWMRLAITSVIVVTSLGCLATSAQIQPANDQPAQARESGEGKFKRPLRRTPRTTTDGVLPLNEAVSLRMNGFILSVPAAYLSPWPGKQVRGRINEITSLSFEFWMPDRRYLEISPLSNASFRPQEPGRAEPAQNAYIVRVWNLRPTVLTEPGYVSPERAFQNQKAARQPPGSQFSFHLEDFGLLRFWANDEPIPDISFGYRNKDGDDPQILLNCKKSNRYRVFPSCSGRVHFVADGVGFFVVFPNTEIARWREIVDAAVDLFKSWKGGS